MTDQQAIDLAQSHTDELMLMKVSELIETFVKAGDPKVLVDWDGGCLRDPLKQFLSFASVWRQRDAVKNEVDLSRAMFCNPLGGNEPPPPAPGRVQVKVEIGHGSAPPSTK